MASSKRSYYFIKLHTKYLSNVKFIRLTNDTKLIFIGLYLLAQECDMGGLLIQDGEILSLDDLSLLLHCNDDITKNVDELISSGFIVEEKGGYGINLDRFIDEQGITAFGERAEQERNKWVERQRKYRANKKDSTNP